MNSSASQISIFVINEIILLLYAFITSIIYFFLRNFFNKLMSDEGNCCNKFLNPLLIIQKKIEDVKSKEKSNVIKGLRQ